MNGQEFIVVMSHQLRDRGVMTPSLFQVVRIRGGGRGFESVAGKPVMLSSAAATDFPPSDLAAFPRTAPGDDLDLLALRARCKPESIDRVPGEAARQGTG